MKKPIAKITVPHAVKNIPSGRIPWPTKNTPPMIKGSEIADKALPGPFIPVFISQLSGLQNEPLSATCLYIKSSSSLSTAPFFFSSWIFNPSPRISLHSTSNDTGVPASSVLLPLTMLS